MRPCNICSHLAVYTILSCGDRFVDCSIRVDYFQLLWGFGDMPVMREGRYRLARVDKFTNYRDGDGTGYLSIHESRFNGSETRARECI